MKPAKITGHRFMVVVMPPAVQKHVWSLLIVRGVLQNFGYYRISDERKFINKFV